MIIGLTGPNAAGKGEAADYLKEKGFFYTSLSDIIREDLAAIGKEPTRENMIPFGNKLRDEFGPEILAKRAIAKLNGSLNIVVDSIRNTAEIQELRKLTDFILIGIDAPLEIRFEREKKRGRVGLPQTFEEFIKLEKEEQSTQKNAQQLNECLKAADSIIFNDWTKDSFRRKIDQIIFKRPSWDEYFLKMAFLAAERSTCLRHHVGAVIVKDKRILTTGYNGAPSGTKDCLELGCLRDKERIPSGTRHEICRATHAEQNAIIQAGLHGVSTDGAVIYCTHSPCILCAKMIVNARIRKFITCGKYADDAFKELFKEAKIEFLTIIDFLPRLYRGEK
jgi:dCMP deaminase